MDFYESDLNTCLLNLSAKNEKLEEVMIVKLFHRLLISFATMQSFDIFHRDIKPQNLVVDDKWNIKIIDFSISTILKLGSSTIAEYSVQGTPDFAAPELKTLLMNKIITGEEIRAVYDIGKADVYSLGLTLLQVITLGDVDGFNNEEMQPRVNEIISRLNGWISRLLGKMLKFNPVERPTFANALAMVPMKETVIE